MTTFEWGMLSIAIIGCLMTAGSILGGCVWAVARIKEDTIARIATERTHIETLLAGYTAGWVKERKALEHNTAELGFSLRRHIEGVEKKITEVELWGRDNYALKDDVKESFGELREDIRTLGAEIKADIRNLSTKVDSKH